VLGAGQALNLKIHQPLGGEADHLTQEISMGVFSSSERRPIISSVIGESLDQVIGVNDLTFR
jgi:hypothetical protein